MYSSNCCFLACILLSQEADQVVWYSHFSEFSTVCCDPHSQRLCIVSKAEVDVFLELSCFSYYPADVGNLTSGSSAFSKSNLNIWKFMVHVLLRPGLKNFKHYFASVWDECNCEAVWTFFSIAILLVPTFLYCGHTQPHVSVTLCMYSTCHRTTTTRAAVRMCLCACVYVCATCALSVTWYSPLSCVFNSCS